MTNTCIDPGSLNFEIVENVPLVLRAELDRKTVSIRELMEFEQGTVVPLSRPAGENVDLYASEVYIGSCEILVVDGALAVRLAEIANDTAPEPLKPSPGRTNP
jgi:flagellar motor switch protein FliN